MRIVFFGTPDLAVPSLEAVASAHDLSALVCQPDKPKGRGKRLIPPPTKVWAHERGIEVQQPAKLNDGNFEAWLRAQAPEVCVIVAYGRILKQPILDVPAHGYLNVHPSLLPRYRGPSPIQTALVHGDTETGVTILRLDAGTDTGDLLLQETVPIADDDNAESLSATLGELGAKLILEAIDRLESGTAVFEKQDDALATHSRMYSKEDGRIDWAAPARDLHNLVRAFNPWPVAHTKFGADVIRIYSAHLAATEANAAPGTVLEVGDGGILVATGDGALALDTIQAPGKRALSVADFLRGRSIAPGDRFGET